MYVVMMMHEQRVRVRADGRCMRGGWVVVRCLLVVMLVLARCFFVHKQPVRVILVPEQF